MMGTTTSKPDRSPSVTGVSITKRTTAISELVDGFEPVLFEYLTHHLLELLFFQVSKN